MEYPYPPAPWHLQGMAFQSFLPIPLAQARFVIPSDLELVSVFPGYTLGGLYLSRYEVGSVLIYSELIVAAGFVRFKGELAAWISHIYVDSPTSVAGGRHIWGLPKELASFDWQPDRVTVTQGDRELCQFHPGQAGISFPPWGAVRLAGMVFSGLDAEILKFTSHFQARLRWSRGHLHTPATSPFASLLLAKPWLTLQMQNLRLDVPAPVIVGQWQTPRSQSSLTLQ
jgi:hypothetical protein